jgi:hypothetical protein
MSQKLKSITIDGQKFEIDAGGTPTVFNEVVDIEINGNTINQAGGRLTLVDIGNFNIGGQTHAARQLRINVNDCNGKNVRLTWTAPHLTWTGTNLALEVVFIHDKSVKFILNGIDQATLYDDYFNGFGELEYSFMPAVQTTGLAKFRFRHNLYVFDDNATAPLKFYSTWVVLTNWGSWLGDANIKKDTNEFSYTMNGSYLNGNVFIHKFKDPYINSYDFFQ